MDHPLQRSQTVPRALHEANMILHEVYVQVRGGRRSVRKIHVAKKKIPCGTLPADPDDPAIHRTKTPAEPCICSGVRSCCMRWHAHVQLQKNPIFAAVCNAGRRMDRPGLSVSNATAVLLSPCRRMAK